MDFSSIFINDFKILLPEIFLVLTISMVVIYGSIYGTLERNLPKNMIATREGFMDSGESKDLDPSVNSVLNKTVPIIRGPVLWICIQILFIGGILAWNSIFPSGDLLYGCLYHDNLTATIKGIVFVFGGFCLLASKSYLRREGIHAFEYPLLVLLCSFALGLLVSSYDLISLYLSLELQSLGLYVLATFKRGSAFSTEAGLKYFMVGAFGSGLLLFGSSLIYGSTGTTNFEDLGRLTLGLGNISAQNGFINSVMGDPNWYAFLGGLIFISAGLLFKLAAAPFHMWSPDVYEGAPTSSTMVFTVLPKIALLGLLIRIYYVSFYDLMSVWQSFIIFASFSSMIVGSIGALYQRRIKRFLAYSSIGHIAYLLLALSCGTVQGLQGLLLYTFIYMVMSLNLWTVLLCTAKQGNDFSRLRRNEETRNKQSFFSDLMPLTSPKAMPKPKGSPVKYLDELVLISRSNPALGFSVIIAIFSMAGIPPMAGFWAKALVFFAAMESALYALAILAVLTSVIGAFYYLRWLKVMYFENPFTIREFLVSKDLTGKKTLTFGDMVATLKLHQGKIFVDREASIIIAISTLFMIFFFTYPAPFLILAHNMVLSICY